MKQVRSFSTLRLALLALASYGGGLIASADSGDNVYTETDSDGVPLSISQPNRKPLSEAQITAARARADSASQNRDWLVNDYEKEVRAQAIHNREDPNSNLYYELSTNPELAKLAGLPVSAPMNDTPETSEKTAIPNSSPGSSSTAAGRDLFKPLITPLSDAQAATTHTLASTTPFLAPLPLSGDGANKPASSTGTGSFSDAGDVNTPGMIAASHDPAGDPLADSALDDPAASDMSLDVLPGETAEQARKDQDARLNLALPNVMTAGELHKQEAAHDSLRPQAVTALTPTATATVKPQQPLPPEKDPNAPIPAAEVMPVSRAQAPIASPYDILNR